jgi:prepilin-type N-terminal cleavage/methylation domain-containing protein
MSRLRKKNAAGFTLIEMAVVLILISVIAAYVIGRSITTEQIELAGNVDKIRNHIRYAQSMAMKRSDTIWGISCDGNNYWLFRTAVANRERIPGEANNQISLSDLGISMDGFTLVFDRYGIPYTDIARANPVSAANPLSIIISAGPQNRSLAITPQTGLVR